MASSGACMCVWGCRSGSVHVMLRTWPNVHAPSHHVPCFRLLRQLADTYKHDLRAWRRARERRGTKDLAAGLAILDADGGAGWDLACNLVQYRPEDR